MPKKKGNLIFLGIAQLFRLGSGLSINVLLMRMLGVEGFGVYGYVMTLVNLMLFGATLGMERLINRALSREPERADELVSAGLIATIGLSLLTGLLIVLIAIGLDGRASVVAAAALGALALGLQSMASIPEAAIHASRQMKLSVYGHLAGRVALVGVTVLMLLSGAGLVSVFVAQVVDGLLTLGIIAHMFRRHLSCSWVRPSLPSLAALVREALPFGLNLLFGSLYLSVDVVILAWMHDDAAVGSYRGAVMLIALFPVIANTLTTGVFPRMSRHLGRPEQAGAELSFVSRVLLAIGLPASVGGLLLAEPLMVFIGGADFSVSATPFMIMAPLLPLRFLNNGFATTLSALNRQGDRTRGVLLAAILNLIANLLIIPAHGAAGAAATTLGTEIMLMVWLRWRIQPVVTGLRLPMTLLRVIVPAAVMALVLVLLPTMHVLVMVTVGAGVYGGVGLLTGAIQRDDLRQLRRV
ncbi:MAG: flippase [Myxococcota bacterium]|nr:flippase [Myxococcota bacterium]